jgi:hypothetical protein
MKVSEMFPKKYASGEDLKGQPVSLTIDSLHREQMHPQPGSPAVEKWVIYFKGATKGIILSAPLARQIAQVLHDEETETWKGKRITIYPEPMTVAGKQRVAIRARASTNGESTPPAGLQDPEEAD